MIEEPWVDDEQLEALKKYTFEGRLVENTDGVKCDFCRMLPEKIVILVDRSVVGLGGSPSLTVCLGCRSLEVLTGKAGYVWAMECAHVDLMQYLDQQPSGVVAQVLLDRDVVKLNLPSAGVSAAVAVVEPIDTSHVEPARLAYSAQVELAREHYKRGWGKHWKIIPSLLSQANSRRLSEKQIAVLVRYNTCCIKERK